MKKLIIALLSVGAMLTGMAHAAEQQTNPGGIGGVESLRGKTELEATHRADSFKHVPGFHEPDGSNYIFQPPLIPHSIRHYEVSLNANKCLSCHSWKNSKQSGAPKVSVTHYENREDQVLSDVSPRRYFCLQCHVTQHDAKPLVGNNFKPVESLR